MDIDQAYKQLKDEARILEARERELKARLDKIKSLRTQNDTRKSRIADLEEQLAKLLGV